MLGVGFVFMMVHGVILHRAPRGAEFVCVSGDVETSLLVGMLETAMHEG